MKPSRWLYRLAVSAFSGALVIFAAPTLAAVAAVSIGDVTFGWGHVLVLIACGAIYGDTRTNRARDREEQKRDRDEIRAEMKELRQEMRELWTERR